MRFHSLALCAMWLCGTELATCWQRETECAFNLLGVYVGRRCLCKLLGIGLGRLLRARQRVPDLRFGVQGAPSARTTPKSLHCNNFFAQLYLQLGETLPDRSLPLVLCVAGHAHMS